RVQQNELQVSGPPYHVLFIEPVAERGGAQVVMLDLLRGLDRAQFVPHVALLAHGPLAAEVRALGVDVAEYPTHRVRNVPAAARAVRWLVALARDRGIHLLHTQGNKTHVYGGLVRLFTGLPELWHLYDPPPEPPTLIDRV